MKIRVPFPSKGVSEGSSASTQPQLTAKDAKNVGFRDPVTGRFRGAQRAGLSRYSNNAVQASKIQDGVALNVDAKNITYTAYGATSGQTGWSSALPQNRQGYQVVADVYGSVYYTDPPSGVVKYNSVGAKLWELRAPVSDPKHEIRTVAVDDSQWVFCAVSAGGQESTAKVFGYKQENENKTKLVWDMTPGGFIEKVLVRDGELYLARSEPSKQRAYCQVYINPNSATPELKREWRIPYPVNDFDISLKDKSVYTAHAPLADRNWDPVSTIATSWWEDWTIRDLSNLGKRLWCHLDASDIDGDDTFNADYEQGDEILVWYDKSGNNRNAYKNLSTGLTTEHGPLLAKKSIAGRDTLAFDGVSASMSSDSNTTSGTAIGSPLDRSAQRTLIPTYQGAEFALFMVVRCDPTTGVDCIFSQSVGGSYDGATQRGILTNRAPENFGTASPTVRASTLSWHETNGLSATTGPTGGSGPGGLLLPGFQGGDGLCLVTVIVQTGSANCTFRVNGRPVDRWTTSDLFSGTDSSFLGWYRTVTAGTAAQRFNGLLCEWVCLSDWYVNGSTPLDSPTKQTLLTEAADYPDAAWVPVGSVSELDQIEGWLAHKWGLAHKLPMGSFNALKFTGNAAVGETFTINGRVYTWKDPGNLLGGGAFPFVAADDIAVGTTAYASAYNAYLAINLIGVSGTTYHASTTINTTVKALGVSEFGSTSGQVAIAMCSRAESSATPAVLDGMANGAWESANFFTSSGAAATGNLGQYPHRYYLRNVSGITSQVVGGPPKGDGTSSRSQYHNLNTVYGMTCKWDPVSAKLRWVLCTDSNPGLTTGVGGVGYGVATSSTGLVYCTGPRDTVFSTAGQSNRDFRAVTDKGDSHSLLSTASESWQISTAELSTNDGAQIWDHPRLSVDRHDNVYIPYYSAGGSTGMFVYTKAGVQLSQDTLSGYSRVMSVAHKPGYPDYGTDLNGTGQTTAPRAEHVYLGTQVENTGTLTFSVIPNDGDTVTFTYQGVSYVYTFRTAFTAPTTAEVLIGATAATAAANFVSCINHTGNPGTDYDNAGIGATASTIVGAILATSTTVAIRGLYPISNILPSTTSNSVQVAESTSGARLVWSGLTSTTYLTTATTAAWRRTLVYAPPSTGSPRLLRVLVVCGNGVYYDNSGAWAAVSGATFSQSAQYVQSTTLFQKAYFTNGDQYLAIDAKPTTPTYAALTSTSAGEIPPRCKLIETWRARLVLARSPDDAHSWFMSAVGDPGNWDFSPPAQTPDQAVSSSLSLAGRVPDIINCIIPYNDDLLLFGCDHSIWRLTGDPMRGGQIDLVTDVTGMAFGRPYDKDPSGNLYFFGSRGGLYVMSPGGQPKDLSDGLLTDRLSDIDLSTHYVRLVWNDTEQCLHIFVMPFGSGGTQVEHFRWEPATKAFWPDTYGTTAVTSIQPTAALVVDGDATEDRVVVLGCEDGVVRKVDSAAYSDDYTGSYTASPTYVAVDSMVTFGPFRASEELESRITALQTVLAKDQQGSRIHIFASDTPDSLGHQVYTGDVFPGRSDWTYVRARGAYFWVQLRSYRAQERWAFEDLVVEMSPAGRTRIRG